jgi:protein-S-isoprenylcysteine O-methyltransferase Ste14
MVSVMTHEFRAIAPVRMAERKIVAAEAETSNRATEKSERSSPIVIAIKLVSVIIGVMALGALTASALVLDRSLVGLGFCVALLIMLFIGMPLIFASLADAMDAHHAADGGDLSLRR